MDLSIHFLYLSQKNGKDDCIELRDGISQLSPLIGKFLGSGIPTSIQTTQNNMWMKWENYCYLEIAPDYLNNCIFRFNAYTEGPGFIVEYNTIMCGASSNCVSNTGMFGVSYIHLHKFFNLLNWATE